MASQHAKRDNSCTFVLEDAEDMHTIVGLLYFNDDIFRS